MEITLINTNLAFGNASTEDVTLTVVKKAGTLNNSGTVRQSDTNDYGEVDISQFNSGYIHCELNMQDPSRTTPYLSYNGAWSIRGESNEVIASSEGSLSDTGTSFVLNLSNYTGATRLLLGIPNPRNTSTWSVVWKSHA